MAEFRSIGRVGLTRDFLSVQLMKAGVGAPGAMVEGRFAIAPATAVGERTDFAPA
jgi:hypothetical protein